MCKVEVANIEKWGSDKDHNILYITGYPGCGKTTLAEEINKSCIDCYIMRYGPNNPFPGYHCEIINLDYFYADIDDYSLSNDDFNDFFVKDLTALTLHEAIQDYAAYLYDVPPSSKIIVEGIQIADGCLNNDIYYYKDQPIIIMRDRPLKSMARAFTRDGRGSLFKGLKDLGLHKTLEIVDWYCDMHEAFKALVHVTNAKKKEIVSWRKRYLTIRDRGSKHQGVAIT